MGPQAALAVPPKLFGGQPPHALNEAAFHLADINRRVQGLAHIVQNIGAIHVVFTGQRINGNL